MPYAEVAGFVQALREYQPKSAAAYALDLVILTGVRTNEALGAKWAEIDIANALWTIPKDRMKTGGEHRVPLSPSAMRIVRAMAAIKRSDYVFPSPTRDGQLSHIVLQKVMARLGAKFTVHGFRSSLRDWAGDETAFPREVCEGVLAHVVGGVEGAYRGRTPWRSADRCLPLGRTTSVETTMLSRSRRRPNSVAEQRERPTVAGPVDTRASRFSVYAYPAFLRYAAHSAGGYWARISPQASEMAS